MIQIVYTYANAEGEPGPNFYWRGLPSDYLALIMYLYPLGVHNGVEKELNKYDGLEILDNLLIMAKSSPDGNTLVSFEHGNIVIDLDCTIWRRIFHVFLSISFFASHNYIEFNDLRLKEDANFIISSELSQ